MNSWVVKVSHIESGDMGSILAECRNLWLLTAVLRGTEAVSTQTRALIYCCAVHNFFFLGFSQWQSRADRVFTLKHEHPTSTVLEHLESGPRPGLGHMCWPGLWAVIIAFV